MYQRIILIGHLGGDPQMRFTPEGVPVTTFSVATNRKWTDASGNPQEKTVWFRVTTWRKLAEQCNQYLAKGKLVMVEGELESDPQSGGPRVWTDRDGHPRASYEVTARAVRFLGGAGQGAAGSMGGAVGGLEDAGGPIGEEEVSF